MFKAEKIKANVNTIFCDVNLIISDNSLVGKKAPAELVVIAKFKLLKSLIPEKLSKIKIKIVKKEYRKKTFIIIFFMSLNKLVALSGL